MDRVVAYILIDAVVLIGEKLDALTLLLKEQHELNNREVNQTINNEGEENGRTE